MSKILIEKETVDLSLEALENVRNHYGDYWDYAISSIREALDTSLEQPANESVFIAVVNYRKHKNGGKKERTPHYDGVSWLHSIIGISRTREGAERMAKDAEEAYHFVFQGYREWGNGPMYVWEVEERAIEEAVFCKAYRSIMEEL